MNAFIPQDFTPLKAAFGMYRGQTNTKLIYPWEFHRHVPQVHVVNFQEFFGVWKSSPLWHWRPTKTGT